ncbi:MAG: ADP-glyceromanno-heptose 6-epimerase [Brumimicrobium sp.]|nr:ADP-glyceromanno-heptose 6-epimerase [Brumimicrobium sp.]
MIVVTGAAGFIGSCLVSKLNDLGITHIILVDEFNNTQKEHNLVGKKFVKRIDRKEFIDWLKEHGDKIEFVFHLGARTDTTEFDKNVFDELNLNYSKAVWRWCTHHQVPMIYASSAATYGMGEHGFVDDHFIVEQLKPLNPYGESKNDFDKWVLKQHTHPPFWAGVKFFNVYGPNEYHKGRMASVVLHAFRQIMRTGEMKLFRSHNPKFDDGEQRRDFIYIKDVLNILYFLMSKKPKNGIYNLGSGKARTFLDLTKITFSAMNRERNISFVDTPEDIRDKYQYFTEATINKLIEVGYEDGFHTLEQGVTDYVKNYLMEKNYF